LSPPRPEFVVAPFAHGLGAELLIRHAVGVRRGGRGHRRLRSAPTAGDPKRSFASTRRWGAMCAWKRPMAYSRLATRDSGPCRRAGNEGVRRKTVRHAARRLWTGSRGCWAPLGRWASLAKKVVACSTADPGPACTFTRTRPDFSPTFAPPRQWNSSASRWMSPGDKARLLERLAEIS